MRKLSLAMICAGFLLGSSLSLYAQANLLDTSNSASLGETVEAAETESEDTSKTVTLNPSDSYVLPMEKAADDPALLATNSRTAKFLTSLKKLADKIEADNKKGDKWYWSNSNNKRTLEKQEKSGIYVSNNALFVVWGLAESGVFTGDEKFFTRPGTGELVWSSGTKQRLLKFADIMKVSGTPESLIEVSKVKPGDICCTHDDGTFVYAGKGYWFDASRQGSENKVIDGKHYYKAIYSTVGHPKAELTYIIRLRDESVTAVLDESVTVDDTTIADADDDTDTTPAVDGDTRTLAGFLASLKKISDIVKKENDQGKPWFYSNSGNKNTMEAQRKSGRKCSNCALYVVWALADCGVFEHNEKFYGAYEGKMAYRNSAEEDLKKYCTITHPNKTANQLIKEGKLKAGDICCYPIQHTNVYAGDKKWWDAGRGSGNTYQKGDTHYFKSMYSKNGSPGCKVTTLIRFKK